MKYLVIFKRFEIWLLLAVLGFVFYSAFRPEPKNPEPVAEEPSLPAKVPDVVHVKGREVPKEEDEPAPEQKELQVEEVVVLAGGKTKEEQGRLIEVTLLARSNSGKPVDVNEETLKAATEKGASVPHFFEPFQKMQTVAAEEASLVTVRFWLEHPAEKMWLDFQGERAEVVLPGGDPKI